MSALDKGISQALSGGCPDALAPVIRAFANAVCELFEDQNIGVLLVGSASRGELSWHMAGDKTELFSDIEFLIGIDHHDHERQAQVDRRAHQITQAADLGAFFHIDYTFIEWSKLPRLDTKFFIFESKERGIDLCTFELAPKLPTTTRANLNWKELNEILIHRLSSIVHAIPDGFFESALGDHANQQFALALAKNTLDITTWLHPYESASLVAGYGHRVDDWRKTRLQNQTLSKYFSDTDLQYLQSCIELRKTPSVLRDSREMLQRTLHLYSRSIRYCKHMNSIEEQHPVSGFATSKKLFDEYRLRPRLSQAVSILKNARAIGLAKIVRNLIGVRRGLAVEICSDLITAALQWTSDEPEALGLLSRARQSLSKVCSAPDSRHNDFPSQWRATRSTFAKYQQITHNY